MTREEAKLKMLPPIIRSYLMKDDKQGRIDKTDEVIDEIYDYFKSRTCENCKHYRIESESCCNNRSFVYNLPIAIHKDFGCNKFEAKGKK